MHMPDLTTAAGLTHLSTHLVNILLLLGIVLVAYTLYRLQQLTDAFDLRDLIVGPDGKVGVYKFSQLGCFLISSWGFVHLTWDGHLTEWYFTTYMAIWSGIGLANKYLLMRENLGRSETSKVKMTDNDGSEVTVEKTSEGKPTPPTKDKP